MYSEWASLQHEIQLDTSNTSVLHSFPEAVGKDVACVVVKNLAQHISMGAANSEPSNLQTDKEVRWTMEVLCYGLSLPLSEHETIRECVNVYCEWMSALTDPKVCVPRPIHDSPNPYACDMMHHLYNLFVPRPDAGVDLVKRQALLCHRVLRTVQNAAQESLLLDRATWECLLRFLLTINDTLLAPPAVKDNIGEQLGERVLSVLFEIWLLACARCFPSPPLWKTFRDMCATWRHHEALVMQWHRFNVVLASRVLKFTYGPDYPELHISPEDVGLIPEEMGEDCVAQCWFRYLHLLANPVDLSQPEIISKTPKFLHMALTSEAVIDPYHYPCLRLLPLIFLRAMRGISFLVDAFLGISQPHDHLDNVSLGAGSTLRQSSQSTSTGGSTPPAQRKSKTFSLSSAQPTSKGSTKASLLTPKVSSASSGSTPSSSPSQVTLESRAAFAAARPKVNSILHLYGAWLFEAAITGVKVHGSEAVVRSRSRTASFLDADPARGHSSLDSTSEDGDAPVADCEAGRAEACGALCRIFCSHKTGEEILPVYLSRFYIALYYGLQVGETLSGQVMSNIIFNACDLLRIDLDGVMILVPQMLKALELILTDLSPRFRSHEQIAPVELRKASIHQLLSILCLPLHFKTLPIRHIFDDHKEPTVTFLSLKMQMIELLLRALTVETDPANTQMLLGGLMLAVQDLALCEEAEKTTIQEVEGDMVGGPPSPGCHDSGIVPMVASAAAAAAGGARTKPASTTTSPGSAAHDYVPYADTIFPRPSSVLKHHDSAHGLFGHAASLVCNRLMASWKMDLSNALAAIEVLSGLAKVKLNNRNMLMCKRTVNWICEFIVYQCSRPAPAHSKDLHSMIVAAFHCLTVWLVEHEYLMLDKECLQAVLEVVELGISGSKSQPAIVPGERVIQQDLPKGKHDRDSKSVVEVFEENRASDIPRLKGEKELKPVSLRVKDAAEALLTSIMDHVGSFPPPCGPESVCSLLDEEALLKHCKDGGLPEQGSPFRYFVLDGATIIGLLEQPLGNDQDPLPTVTALIRGPFGRHAWTMQLRHLPRHKKAASKSFLSMPRRPEPNNNVGVRHNVKHRIFPEIVDHIPLVEADKSIPPLKTVMSDQASDLERLEGLIRDQMAFETKVKDKVRHEQQKTTFPNTDRECLLPEVSHDFQTARLFLSHYSFLSLEALKDPPNSSLPPSLVMLDTTKPSFQRDLEQLDAIPCRTSDTVFIFYVKSGQKTSQQILNNVTSKVFVQPAYMEFLQSLGWPVDVQKHAGWTGHTATSWKIMDTEDGDEFYPGDSGGSLYDGQKQVLYWADVSAEVAFVVPSPDTVHQQLRRLSADSVSSMEKTQVQAGTAEVTSRSVRSVDMAAMKPKSLSLDLERPPAERPRSTEAPGTPTDGGLKPPRRSSRLAAAGSVSDTKIFVVWLESYEDYENFPSGELLQSTHTGLEVLPGTVVSRHGDTPLYIIFIHALKSGLFRLHMAGHTGRTSMAIPLVDGMVVSQRTLGTLVRQTAINICRRRRLENEASQLPHVRRKLKTKEIVDKYRNKLIEPEFYTSLFQDVLK